MPPSPVPIKRSLTRLRPLPNRPTLAKVLTSCSNQAQPVAAAPEPDGPSQSATQPVSNRGDILLTEAKELYKNGNYQASKQIANEAKSGKFGVEAQADELIAADRACRAGRGTEPLRSGTGGTAYW